MFDADFQPNLPLDERFRQAEQYALGFEAPKEPQPDETARMSVSVCIGCCPVCRECDS